MIQKYSAALTAVAITLVAALAQLTNGFHGADAIQIVLLGVNAVAIYFFPLVAAKYQDAAKTSAAVVIAILTAVLPLVTQGGHISGAQIAIVVLAGLQALGSHIGVHLRAEVGE
jgi:hypothetical protein